MSLLRSWNFCFLYMGRTLTLEAIEQWGLNGTYLFRNFIKENLSFVKI
jgi:hypothetical protein